MPRKSDPKCWREINGTPCAEPLSKHTPGCPRDPSRSYAPHAKATGRAATSFSAAEVAWMKQLMGIATRGGDARVLMRQQECRVVYRKVLAMEAAIAGAKALSSNAEKASAAE